VPYRRAGTVAGSAIGREALDCRRGGERRQDQAGDRPRGPRRALPLRQDRYRWRVWPRVPRCRRGGERREHQGRRSAARPLMPAWWRARRRRPVLAGAERWGVLGSRIKHYRSHSMSPVRTRQSCPVLPRQPPAAPRGAPDGAGRRKVTCATPTYSATMPARGCYKGLRRSTERTLVPALSKGARRGRYSLALRLSLARGLR
jgi:hypothetical protein